MTTKDHALARALAATRPEALNDYRLFQWESDVEAVALQLERHATLKGRAFDKREWKKEVYQQ